jgi:NitT/TauT family transport system ATP-binding protein
VRAGGAFTRALESGRLPTGEDWSIPESIFQADRIVVMAPRPGTVRETVDVGMPHPRERSRVAFVNLEREIKRLVREEVAKPGVT